MWRKAVLRMPSDMSTIMCSMVPVHPWVYGAGQSAGDGSYLSPVNAVDYLAPKLANVAEEMSAVIYMLCAPTHVEFMTLIGQFSSVFPLPVFAQVRRRAQEAATLTTTKMQLPGAGWGGLPIPQPLSTTANRLALNAQRIIKAKAEAALGSNLGGMQTALSEFDKVRDSALSLVNQALSGLQGQSAPAWVFSAKGNASYIAAEMKKNVPQSDAIYTLAVMFIGKDLGQLEAMINDDNHAGA